MSTTIGEPLSLGTPQMTMNRDCDGALYCLQIQGGYGPYSYNWSNGAEVTTNCIQLSSGNYTVTITDASGQHVTTSCTIPGSSPISISSNIVPNCIGQNTGLVDLTIGGGAAPLSYVWSNGAVSQDISSLSAGTYTVSVTDNVGCSRTGVYTVTDYGGFDLNEVVEDACDVTEDGAIFINPTGGAAPYTYEWNSTVFGGNSGVTSFNEIYDLAPNTTHSVTVTDVTGCVQVNNILIDEATETVVNNTNAGNCSIDTECKGAVVDRDYKGTDNFIAYFRWWEQLWNPLPYTCRIDINCPLNNTNYTVQGWITESVSGFPIYEPPASLEDYRCTKIIHCQAIGEIVYEKFWYPNGELTEKEITNSTGCYDVFCEGENIGSYCDFAKKRAMGDLVTYPNPFDAFIRITLINNTSDEIELTLLSITGQEIFKSKYAVEQGNAHLAIKIDENLPKGVYVLTIKYEDGTFTNRKMVHK